MKRLAVRIGRWLVRWGGADPLLPIFPTPAGEPLPFRELAKLYHRVFSPVFSAPGYAPILADLSRRAFLTRSTTEGALDEQGRVDPCKVSAHEGQRALVLWLYSMVQAAAAPGDPERETKSPVTR